MLEDWHKRYYAIGDPEVACPKCGARLAFGNVYEWQQLQPIERGLFLVIFVVQNAFYSALFSAIVAIGVELVLHLEFFVSADGQPTRQLLIFVCLISFTAVVIRSIGMRKTIETSRRRLANKQAYEQEFDALLHDASDGAALRHFQNLRNLEHKLDGRR